ncbi:hypothetical protein [Citrobacter freundii]|uniref:Uncharacterized protein n=1 Tax=Citrobacter freundii TaxID=546 RepID=A0A7G2IZU4_CITFR|nr:hypothetical protein [Citrobacter freundii]
MIEDSVSRVDTGSVLVERRWGNDERHRQCRDAGDRYHG